MLPLHIDLDLPITPEQVLAAMAEPDYQHAKNRAAGAESNTTAVTNDQGVLRIRNSRIMPPEVLPAAVRPFAPSPLELVEDQQWVTDGQNPQGRIRITVPGAPVQVEAVLTLSPQSGGSRLVADGQVRADVPLLGARVEQGLQPVVRGGFEVERQALLDWTARD